MEVKRGGLRTWTMTWNQQAPPGGEGSEGAFQDVVLEVASSEPLGAKMGERLTFEFWQQDITDEDVLQSSF